VQRRVQRRHPQRLTHTILTGDSDQQIQMTRRHRDEPATAGRLLNRRDRRIAGHRVAAEFRQLKLCESALRIGGRLVPVIVM